MGNFTDRNKAKFDNDAAESGFRMIDMSDENGYGSAEKNFSKGAGTYSPQAQSSAPDNYDGMGNFRDPKFAGSKTPPDRVAGSLSGGYVKDAIDTMGQEGGNSANLGSY